jgi:hypothetical protein
VGLIAAAAVCELPDNPTRDEYTRYSVCSGGISSLGPLLLGSRTVRYKCKVPVGPLRDRAPGTVTGARPQTGGAPSPSPR